MTTLLLSQDIHAEGRKLIDGKFDIIIPGNSQDALLAAVPRAEGIILRVNLSVTAEVIKAAPRLKIISRTGAGVDNIDLAAASGRGILVCTQTTANHVSVAEHAVAMIYCLAKDLFGMDRAIRSGDWKRRNCGRSVELEGKTLGVVGMGHIGSLVARKCRMGLGMKILAYDPYAADKFRGEDYEFVPDLGRLFAEADFVTIHCPNSPETKGMISGRLLASMKESSFIVNCARGGVVDEDALYNALKDKKIAGAALDVFSVEPPGLDNPLLGLPNVILSPHSAGMTREAIIRMSTQAAQTVVDYFSGKKLTNIYNAKDLGL